MKHSKSLTNKNVTLQLACVDSSYLLFTSIFNVRVCLKLISLFKISNGFTNPQVYNPYTNPYTSLPYKQSVNRCWTMMPSSRGVYSTCGSSGISSTMVAAQEVARHASLPYCGVCSRSLLLKMPFLGCIVAFHLQNPGTSTWPPALQLCTLPLSGCVHAGNCKTTPVWCGDLQRVISHGVRA